MQVEVGQIVNTHGIKGEVKVKSNSDFTDTFSTWRSPYRESPP